MNCYEEVLHRYGLTLKENYNVGCGGCYFCSRDSGCPLLFRNESYEGSACDLVTHNEFIIASSDMNDIRPVYERGLVKEILELVNAERAMRGVHS